MKLFAPISMIMFSGVLSACCHMNRLRSPTSQPVSKVLDQLKDDLALFANTAPKTHSGDKQWVCRGVDGGVVANIIPTSATLILKVAVAGSDSGNAGISVPIGNVLTTIDPKLSGSYSNVQTQQFTVDLGIDHGKSAKELRTDIARLQKEVSDDEKMLKSVQDEQLKRNITINNIKKNQTVLQEYKDLLKSELTAPSYANAVPYSEGRFSGHPLAETLWQLREQILSVDHSKTPCLVPSQLKTQVDFEVVDKTSAGLGLSFVIVSIGGEAARSSDITQSLLVAFDMAGDSTSQFEK